MATKEEYKNLRQQLAVIVMLLEAARIRLPEAMTADRVEQLTNQEMLAYAKRLFGHEMWRSVPQRFLAPLGSGTNHETGRAQLVRMLLVGLAPWRHELRLR